LVTLNTQVGEQARHWLKSILFSQSLNQALIEQHFVIFGLHMQHIILANASLSVLLVRLRVLTRLGTP